MAATKVPDVRVRLSAEGVAEVVNAFRRVQSQAATTGKAAAGSISLVSGALATLKGQLLALVPVITVAGFAALAADSAAWADELVRVRSVLALSLSDLRAFSTLTAHADVKITDLQKGLIKFQGVINEANKGTGTAVAKLAALGVTVDDLKNKGTAELFEIAAKNVVEMGDGLAQSSEFVDVFGKRAAYLIPVFKELGERGLPAVREEAQRLGMVFDDRLTESAGALQEQLETLHVQVRSLMQRFTGGLAPAVSQSLTVVMNDLGSGASSWEEWGKRVGSVLRYVILYLGDVFDLVTATSDYFSVAWARFTSVTTAMAQGQMGLARQLSDTYTAQLNKIDKAYKSRSAVRRKMLETDAPAIGMVPSHRTVEQEIEEQESVFAARLTLVKQQTDREIKLARAASEVILDDQKDAYDDGLMAVGQYYEARRREIGREMELELALLGKRLLVEKQIDDEKERNAALEKTSSDMEDARLKAAQSTAKSYREETKEVRQLAEQRSKYDERIYELKGQFHNADMARIDEEVEAYATMIGQLDRVMVRAGESQAMARARARDEFRALLNNNAAFVEAGRQANYEFDALARDRQSIDDQVAAGLLSQSEAEFQLLDVEKQRVAALGDLAREYVNAAVITGDQGKIDAALRFQQSVEQVRLAIETTEGSFRQFKAAGIDATRDALFDLFTTTEYEALTFENVMVGVIMNVVNAMRRLAAQMLAVRAANWLGNMVGGGVGGGNVGQGGLPAGVPDVFGAGFAAGGFVSGPTGVDAVPARLTAGEYVVRADRVAQPGVLEHLHRINSAPARFAAGGLVGSPSPGGATSHSVTIDLAPGLVAKAIEQEGGDAIIRVLSRKRRAARGVIG